MKRTTIPGNMLRTLNRDKYLLLIFLPPLLYFIVFHYLPMYGLLIAFKNYNPVQGIMGSAWLGFENFTQFFNSYYFWRLLKNTLLLSVYSLIFGFPAPILFALLLNELKDSLFKRTVQTVSYLPHFISIVVVAGMIVMFTSPLDGVVNRAIEWLGFERINFLSEPSWFRTIFVASGVWQSFGWGSIIYLAAISGINPQLYEAAEIDGAKRWHKIVYVTIPCILPTIIILLILDVGKIMEVGLEKVLLLYSPATYETSDIIATFVYRRGIQGADFSYATAIGLFNNMINLVVLVIANTISRRLSDTSLW